MIQSAIDIPRTRQASVLFLDFGADSQVCEPGELEVSEHGMCFHSCWQFEEGSVISVACVKSEFSGEQERSAVEGLVARCEMVRVGDKRMFRTTVAFLSVPEECRRKLRALGADV